MCLRRNAAALAALCGLALFTPAGLAFAQKGAQPQAPPANADPMRFSTGAVTLKVKDYDEARSLLLEVARQQGAELIDARTDVTQNGRRHGWVRLSFPSNRLPDVISAVRPLGTLYAEKVTNTENASEFDGLRRRADKLHDHQQRLAGILSSERRLRGSDILYVQERLFRASVDEELLAQRRADISRRATVSTLLVQLFEPVSVRRSDRARLDLAAHFAGTTGNARAALDRVTGRALTGLAYAVVWTPVWLPVLLGAGLLLRLAWRRLRPLASGIGAGVAVAARWAVARVAAIREARTARASA